MLKNRKIQILGATVLIVIALLVTISASKPPAPAYIPITGGWNELAEYHRSERNTSAATPATAQSSVDNFNQTERTVIITGAYANDPLYGYHMSEWFGGRTTAANPVIARTYAYDPLYGYHMSERFGGRTTAANPVIARTYADDPLYEYHMSEWFGK